MQKYLLKMMAAGLVLLLVGCQTNNGTSTVFNPFPLPQSNVSLAQSVQDALILSDDPVIAQVRVATNQNVVILSGYVKKIRQSDVAEQIARKVPGVQNVQNNLIVRQ